MLACFAPCLSRFDAFCPDAQGRHGFAIYSEIPSILGTQDDFIYWAMAESAFIFDTHEDIQELVKSGMPEPQAETVVRQRVRLLERNLATKADIAATNANIETLRQETKADIAATNANIETLRQETKADIAATNANIETLRQETKADIAATNANIETLRQETKADIETLRQETKADIAATNANIETLRLETKADIAATNANIETLRQETEKLIALGKNDIIKWVVGANLGVAALIVAAIKLL